MEGKRLRKRQKITYKYSASISSVSTTKIKDKPRWWNQTYLLFLVLRKNKQPMLRRDLIPAALALDLELSKERGLPKLFGGQTPWNTASGILTENRDKLFVQSFQPGCKYAYFSLAFEPGSFQSALDTYNSWTRKLITLDWPILFSKRRDEFFVMDKGKIIDPVAENTNVIEPLIGNQQEQENNTSNLIQNQQEQENIGSQDESEALDAKVKEILETEWIPKSLDDVVEVKDSSIPNAGQGLFARINIPKNTFLGFYFGLPMTEDEFDSLKEHKGVAAQYVHRYRKTVLDATDDDGNLYNSLLVNCPFYFINENKSRVNTVFVEGYEVNQVLCMTLKNIEAGQELFCHYGKSFPRDWET